MIAATRADSRDTVKNNANAGGIGVTRSELLFDFDEPNPNHPLSDELFDFVLADGDAGFAVFGEESGAEVEVAVGFVLVGDSSPVVDSPLVVESSVRVVVSV